MDQNIRKDADAPALDRAVTERLHRLDPDLWLSWSKRLIDPLTGAPIKVATEADSENAGECVIDPHWYLWVRCPDGLHRLVAMYPHFGHEQVAKLERDVGREHGRHLFAVAATVREKLQKQRRAEFDDLQKQKIAANTSRIRDLVFEGKTGERQAKPFSAPGLGARGTPGLIVKDSKEDGWELPEPIEGGDAV